jgi:hypothetical protein
MGFATTALYFGALHTMAIVGRVQDATLCKGLKKAGPTAATFEFGLTLEQGLSTGLAMVGAYFAGLFDRAAPGSLGPFLARNVIDIRGKDLLPFALRQVDLSTVGTRVYRVIFF